MLNDRTAHTRVLNVCVPFRLQQVAVVSSSKKNWIIGVVVVAAVLVVIGVALAVVLSLASRTSNVRKCLSADRCTSGVLIVL